MDELLHHCLRELAFDGDLGCDVSRLKDFIVDFYRHSNASHIQNPDDAFCAFVWSLIVRQHTVLVGLVDPNITSDVWIAPQISAKRKAKARGEEHVELRPPKLDPIPEPKTAALDMLRTTYGGRLRLAVETDAIFEAITGSHIRSSKMSPMVYSALQIITRGRDDGITVVELGRRSGYDQKTCFYLVRQLTGLGLVVKVRRGGVGTHFCIHRYFFDRSSSWKAIRDEETQAENLQMKKQSNEPDIGEDDDIEDPESLNFTPIDARHLSSLPLISGRVIKLLKASKNHMHASNNMLITLGFSNPTKTDRRFFQSRIREMIQQRLIDKVVVPSNKKKSLNKSVKCFRLVKHELPTPGESTLILSDADEDLDDLTYAQSGVKLNTTIHKQIIDQLEESGTRGMTLNELSSSLCQFDKRTIELLLARADKYHPPSHLSDLRIASLMETSGRERRHRYFTVANYLKLVLKEELDKSSAGYADVDLNEVGNFQPVKNEYFYEAESELAQYCDTFKDTGKNRTTKTRKVTQKNPVLPNGKVKRGRPRKKVGQPDDVTLPPKGIKRKMADTQEPGVSFSEQSEGPQKKKPRSVIKPGEPLNGKLQLLFENVPLRGPQEATVLHLNSQLSVSERLSPVGSLQEGLTVEDVGYQVPLCSMSPTPRSESCGDDSQEQVPHPAGGLSNTENQSNNKEASLLHSLDISLAEPPTPTATESYDISSSVAADLGIERVSGPMAPVGGTTDILPDVSDWRISEPLRSRSIVRKASGYATATSTVLLEPSNLPTPSSVNPRINVSKLRRENELLKLVENGGGIINIQTKEFYQRHMKLLEVLTKAGESTSAPVGTKTDKRTVTATFNSLENKGRVKQLRTSITTPTGITRPACIIYLPDVDQTRINEFLVDLARASQQPVSHLSSFVKIENHMDYGADTAPGSRGVLPLQLLQIEQPGIDEKERWSKNINRAQQLFSHEDSTIREVFLAERTTMSQAYGFIVGKALRCRELHLAAVKAFETQVDSSHIVSHEKRIVDLSFFCYDLPLYLYCSLVSPLSFDEELLGFLTQDSGRELPVRDLPPSLQSSLQLAKSRARSRILDMLEILRSLNLVVPLQPSTSGAPLLTSEQKSEHPASFELASLEGWTVNTPIAAPVYWHFLDSAPIHLYARSETEPPVWKTVDTGTHGAASRFWDDLREACTNSQLSIDAAGAGPSSAMTVASLSTVRSLRRAVSWKSEYFLTWHQMQYLKQFIDNITLSTPLQISDESERQTQLNRICWVTTAPQEAIVNYFSLSREKLQKTQERLKEKARRVQKRTDETKLSLAKKAEEARIQRGREWETLLTKIHPGALSGPASIRVERLRGQFLQSGSIKDVSRWEKEIQTVLHEADLISNNALKITTKRPTSIRSAPPEPIVIAPMEASIQSLIELQGPPLQDVNLPAKRKRKKDPADPNSQKKVTRRHRFHWNPEFDELARDASVIIRARCRNLPRLDWGAFEQVFPGVPRNTVRQRLTHIRETPGNEAYLRRLEDSWYDIWLKFRGTPHLPDEDYRSASNFDLVKHIEFLRTHVDKNAIRVGFAHAKESSAVVIPSNIAELHDSFDVVQAEKVAPDWDFMWNALIEEGREKKLKRAVLSRCPEEFPPRRQSEPSEVVLAEATLKMVMSTPPERYDAEQGSTLLRKRGANSIDIAKKNLLSRGILSKSQRDPEKQGPGRQLKISESNQNAIGGIVSRDTFQDAVSLLEAIDDDDKSWHEWPLTATDGDCTTLIELVSEDKVDFSIDTSLPKAARPSLDWNSKKADDDQIETGISVRYRLNADDREWLANEAQTVTDLLQDQMQSPELSIGEGHALNIRNDPACCRKMTGQGLVDCVHCLDDDWLALRNSMDVCIEEVANWVIDIVRRGEESGSKKSEAAAGPRASLLPKVVQQLVEAEIPQLYWVGYDSVVLVSAYYIAKWGVMVSKSPLVYVFPRRWLDVRGVKVADFWQAALRAVMGLIIFRPGMTQAEIGWRLRAVYDRQELTDILRYLQGEGYVRYRLGYPSTWTLDGMDAVFDEKEEQRVYWFMGDKHWYQVSSM
ncbi:hypothetical protein CPB84DRAFT_1670756 [Gymnopilus junonius]|uniref:B-block binding subunit of TFIIIC domain-containing protein n=1 Tax=Gymnopilus junonius TaxID=109634 RepID=A0A9P5P0Y2_GYMJU|nr:hypothetical protein CPB84DRAFT_1670756 [Gymnopilus junonius]